MISRIRNPAFHLLSSNNEKNDTIVTEQLKAVYNEHNFARISPYNCALYSLQRMRPAGNLSKQMCGIPSLNQLE